MLKRGRTTGRVRACWRHSGEARTIRRPHPTRGGDAFAMLEPPDFSADRIIAAVSLHYDLNLTTLSFLPLGRDVQAWTYRAVTAAGVPYFLKLRRGSVHPASLRIPRLLADQGATHVVAPLRTRTGELWADVAGLTLTLFPLIDGVTGMARGMEER